MTTAKQIINRAYTILGVRALGETLEAGLLADALAALNSMVDSWRTESLFVFSVKTLVYQLSPGQQTITIGPGMQVDTALPPQIERGAFARKSGIDYPIHIADRVQYDQIILKTVGATYPDLLYFNRSYPVGTIYLYPVPTAPTEIHLPIQDELLSFDELDAEHELPPGYQKALEYSLAEELAPGLTSTPPTAVKIAAQARRVIKRYNHSTPVLDLPIGIASGPRFNIFAGR